MRSIVGLSSREIEVVRLVAHGYSNREIADRLEIKVSTVHKHMANIGDVVGLTRRTQIAVYAIKAGHICIEDIELPGEAEKSEVAQ